MNPDSGYELYNAVDPTTTMKSYIREHFGSLLGSHLALLDEPGGLDRLAMIVRSGSLGVAGR